METAKCRLLVLALSSLAFAQTATATPEEAGEGSEPHANIETAEDVDEEEETDAEEAAAESPTELTIISLAGFLTDVEGNAIDGTTAVTLELFDHPEGGEPIFAENQETRFVSGWFNLFVGAENDLPLDLIVQTEGLFFSLTVDGGEPLMPRVDLGPVAQASVAHMAQDSGLLGGLGPDQFASSEAGDGLTTDDSGRMQVDREALGEFFSDSSEIVAAAVQEEDLGAVRIPQDCTEGYTLAFKQGQWRCIQSPSERLKAGPGITISGQTIAFLTGCSNGQVPKFSAAQWRCAGVPKQEYKAGDGIAVTGSEVKLLPGCTKGQIPKFTSSGWRCGDDLDTQTTREYAAGSGLSLEGTEFSLLRGCQDNQTPKFKVSTGWHCAFDDNSGSTYRGADGIQVVGTEIGFLPNCPNDAVPRFSGPDGWRCSSEEPHPLVAYHTGQGLGLVDSTTIELLPGCNPGMVPLRSEGGWMCAFDSHLRAGNGVDIVDGQGNLLPGCSEGQFPKRGEDGNWLCGSSAVLTGGDGFEGEGSQINFLPNCAGGEIPRFTAEVGWRCGQDATLDEAGVDQAVANNGYASEDAMADVSARLPSLTESVDELGLSIQSLGGGALLPVGSIVPFYPTIVDPPLPVPDGWYPCDGTAIETEAAYGDGGIAAGEPQGSINAPDLNEPVVEGLEGRFLRGAPESGTVEDSALAAHGHGIGSAAIAAVAHDHGRGSYGVPTHNHTTSYPMYHGWSTNDDDSPTTWGNGHHLRTNHPAATLGLMQRSASTNHNHTLTGDVDPAGGTETRPVAHTVVWIIKIF